MYVAVAVAVAVQGLKLSGIRCTYDPGLLTAGFGFVDGQSSGSDVL